MNTVSRSIFPGTTRCFFLAWELGGGMEGERKDGRTRDTLLDIHKLNFQTKLHKLFQSVAPDDSLMKLQHQQGHPGQYREA